MKLTNVIAVGVKDRLSLMWKTGFFVYNGLGNV